jgi:hypothetical protein
MRGTFNRRKLGSAEEQKSGVDIIHLFYPIFLTSDLPIFAIMVR